MNLGLDKVRRLQQIISLAHQKVSTIIETLIIKIFLIFWVIKEPGTVTGAWQCGGLVVCCFLIASVF